MGDRPEWVFDVPSPSPAEPRHYYAEPPVARAPPPAREPEARNARRNVDELYRDYRQQPKASDRGDYGVMDRGFPREVSQQNDFAREPSQYNVDAAKQAYLEMKEAAKRNAARIHDDLGRYRADYAPPEGLFLPFLNAIFQRN
jgi:hypothetical protein